MQEVVDALVRRAVRRWAPDGRFERQDVARLARTAPRLPIHASPAPLANRSPSGPGDRLRIRLRQAGVDPERGLPISERKPAWLRVPVVMGDGFLGLRRTMRDLGLVTVCEEAGCPNIYECWAEGTATFMINGDRCTRACGFCLVDTRHPLPVDPDEPDGWPKPSTRMGLAHAVVTAVARDDLADGGAAGFAATIRAIRQRCPETAVEVLIPDCKGDAAVARHDLRGAARRPQPQPRDRRAPATRRSAVGRLRAQPRRARPSQGPARDQVGHHPRDGGDGDEVKGALADLRAVGVDIVTLGQYLRPSAAHLPVARWWRPRSSTSSAMLARGIGFDHVESSPLTRSSYHARAAAAAALGCTRRPHRRGCPVTTASRHGCCPPWQLRHAGPRPRQPGMTRKRPGASGPRARMATSGSTRCSCRTAPTCPG